jgi:hypothetical protein
VLRYIFGASELRRTNLTTQDYAALAELRRQIRRFVRFSEVDRREVLLTLARPKAKTYFEISHSSISPNFACKIPLLL